MSESFFGKPILNSPYQYPRRHWELDDDGQPTRQTIHKCRQVEFVTPIPQPKKQKKKKAGDAQQQIAFDEAKGISSDGQQYEKTAQRINALRRQFAPWGASSYSKQWKITA